MLDIIGALEEIAMQRDTSTAEHGQSLGAVALLVSEIIRCARSDPSNLEPALQSSLREASHRLDRVSLAVTGLAWLGGGAPSVEQEMIALVKGARHEVSLCAYSVTPGAIGLLSEMKDVVAQGVVATLIVNSLSTQPTEVQSYLKEAVRSLERWRLYDFAPLGSQTELHAKILVVDRWAALIGSANLSFHGLVSNHEMAVVVRGPTAEAIASRIDMLTQQPSVRPVVS